MRNSTILSSLLLAGLTMAQAATAQEKRVEERVMIQRLGESPFQSQLDYASRVSLARDWANAFRSTQQKLVEVRIWQPGVARAVPGCSSCPPQGAEPILYFENVTGISNVGALVMISYKLGSGKPAIAVVPAERLIGIYQGE